MSPIPLGILAASAAGVEEAVAGYAQRQSFNDFGKYVIATNTWSTLPSSIYSTGQADLWERKGVAIFGEYQRYAIATDSWTAISMLQDPNLNAAYSNGDVASYYTRGRNEPQNYKIAYPSETQSSVGNNPGGFGAEYSAGFENVGVAGYHARGKSTTNIYKMSFSTDTVSETTGSIFAIQAVAGFSSYLEFGMFTRANASNVMKYAFPSDTASSYSTRSHTNNAGGFQNANVAGFTNTGDNSSGFNKNTYATTAWSTVANLPFNGQYSKMAQDGY